MRTLKPTKPSDDSGFRRLIRWVRHRRAGDGVRGTGEGTCAPANEGEGLYKAVNVSKGVVLACRVEWAGTSESRRRGLLGRDHIDPSEGAYIVPTQWIHMFGMQFPIDVAFLDHDGRVLHVCHALHPNRLSPIVWRAEGALELAAGILRSTGTEPGDIIEID